MECDQAGVELTQLPHNDCPLLDRQRKASAAASMATSEPVGHPDEKPANLEIPPLPSTITPDPQQLCSPATEVPAEQFIATGLSPERTKFLDTTIDAGNTTTHLKAIGYLIDWGKAEPAIDEVPVVLPDDHIKSIQQKSKLSSPASNKPWIFPKRQLSPDEWKEFFADFVRIACIPKQQQLIETLISGGKFANEMALVDYALDLVGRLNGFAEELNALKYRLFTPGQTLKFHLDNQWFAPVFPIISFDNTNYHGMRPEVLVLSVDVDALYYMKPGGMP
jgi:hypothetical protein